jgi:hypothetical protein
MRFEYTELMNEYEEQLYSVLKTIQSSPGLYLGEPSITKLCHFISGYTYAVMVYKDYRLHFDRDFQLYIESRYPDYHVLHWDGILLKEYGESGGFDVFFQLLDSFSQGSVV